MNKSLAILCLALVASAAASPAYNYSPPAKVTSGFKQVKQNFVSQHVDGSATASAPVQQQQQQQFVAPVQQQQQQQFVAPVQQQQQQQFVAPVQQQQQFVAPVQQQQQQFVAPVQQQQQQFVAPVQQQQQQYVAPAPQYLAPSYQPQPQQHHQQQTIISKEIFIHSSPDEVEEIGNDADLPAGPIRKNYRIVFVKAPTQNVKLNLNALKRAQASNEEKTVIYVLSKKPDLAHIQNQLAVVQNQQKSHKPEVHFIKYKTQEEANRAQQEIQAQYDSLGGSTSITDEGIAPVTSVIGGGSFNVGSLGGFGSGSGFGSDSGFGSGLSTSFQGGNSFSQQQSFETSQSTVGGSSSSVSFGGVSNQAYLPAKKK